MLCEEGMTFYLGSWSLRAIFDQSFQGLSFQRVLLIIEKNKRQAELKKRNRVLLIVINLLFNKLADIYWALHVCLALFLALGIRQWTSPLNAFILGNSWAPWYSGIYQLHEPINLPFLLKLVYLRLLSLEGVQIHY